MDFKLKSFLKKVLILFLTVMPYFVFGQNSKKQIEIVFDQLITVYGIAKSKPGLEIVKKDKLPIAPAKYLATPTPKIVIDVDLYKICQSFGKDSLNALAVVLSHELTHYYNDHTFCSDYAYVSLYSSNPVLAKEIRNSSLTSRKEKETEADIKGFFFAAAAGYKPFGLQGQVIDKIYTAYGLTNTQLGYPSKQDRKELALSAEKQASELYKHFESGLLALKNKQYDMAIALFEKANKIPFRENLNNIGVAKVLKALELKVPSKGEIDSPKRFQYPLEIDIVSRLNKEVTRNSSDTEKLSNLLFDAQKDFEKAITLDPSYYKSRINLACVYDLLGKHLSAIAEITEKLPKETQESRAAKQILAIAYYNADMEEKAEEIWKELKL
jgi:predicted Zn-dependent protease